MFLFTTPAETQARPANPVLDAIRTGAERTGVSFDYLVRTAERESALDPQAKARTSSATGLFQFIDQTWLSMVRSEGDKHGLGDAARAITQGADGRLTVQDPELRARVMELRRDPTVAATMAGAFTQRNREALSGALGREPTGGELYIAHVLGARGATELIGNAQGAPTRVAARDFPEAAAANRGIFYERDGRPRTSAEVYDMLARAHAQIQTAAGPQPEAQAARGVTRPGLMGLFQTDAARGPVSAAVARMWTTDRSQGVRMASLEAGPRFFPGITSDASAAATSATPAPVTTTVRANELPAVEAAAPQKPKRAPARAHRPLDLNAFIRTGRSS